ncbi:hypothetical protein AN958_08305 [Leucoagaricus sp. SymC.cos]|nr:hypothetical protein AN958_08305 [Leucoagaricus sp. SymC.cos]
MHSLSSSYSPVHSVRSRNAKNEVIISPTYSFTQKTTTVSYPWPPTITGVERIALSAQGDLQRVLSAFFARPISIIVIFEKTYWQRSPDTPPEPLKQATPEIVASASPDTPLVQTRQVHLQCSGKVVCRATSTVRMTSANTAQLFLVDKYAIGQTFRRLEKLPTFELLSVGLGPYSDGEGGAAHINQRYPTLDTTPTSSRELWRRYKLTTSGFDCDIVEVFPDRDMFIHGETWLDDRLVYNTVDNGLWQVKADHQHRMSWFARTVNTNFLFTFGFFLILFYEISSFMTGNRLGF